MYQSCVNMAAMHFSKVLLHSQEKQSRQRTAQLRSKNIEVNLDYCVNDCSLFLFVIRQFTLMNVPTRWNGKQLS